MAFADDVKKVIGESNYSVNDVAKLLGVGSTGDQKDSSDTKTIDQIASMLKSAGIDITAFKKYLTAGNLAQLTSLLKKVDAADLKKVVDSAKGSDLLKGILAGAAGTKNEK